MITITDITKHMLSELNTLASLKEKTTLLKEVHHRVKNNLQIISSIINLQSTYVEDAAAQNIFADLISRVRSVSLIHEKLYQSERVSEIKMDGYITDLVRDIKNSYGLIKDNINIGFDFDPIYIASEKALSIGLIITELVTNIFKYAFPDKKGNIHISMKMAGDKTLLTIKDDGIGFPEGLNIEEPESLGMQLVSTLTEQLGGSIKFNRNKGTEISITFYFGDPAQN